MNRRTPQEPLLLPTRSSLLLALQPPILKTWQLNTNCPSCSLHQNSINGRNILPSRVFIRPVASVSENGRYFASEFCGHTLWSILQDKNVVLSFLNHGEKFGRSRSTRRFSTVINFCHSFILCDLVFGLHRLPQASVVLIKFWSNALLRTCAWFYYWPCHVHREQRLQFRALGHVISKYNLSRVNL